MKFSRLAFVAVLLTTSCARDLASNHYIDSSTSGVVLEGVVVSARDVKVSENDRLGGNSGGIAVGGIAGAIAGQNNPAIAVGGAILGATGGAIIQDKLTTQSGMEYIVKITYTSLGSPKPESRRKGRDVVSEPAPGPRTELVSVVQGNDQKFSVGQKVYVIYADDRPRMTAAQ